MEMTPQNALQGEEHMLTLTWLRRECKTKSQAEVARITGLSSTTISRVLSGTYAGDMERVMGKLSAVRCVEREREEEFTRIPYVETSTARTIARTCDRVRLFGHLTRLIGRSQIGKTWAARHYAETHPNTLLITMPNNPTTGAVVRPLASALGVPYCQATDRALDAIAPKLSRNALIIVDECQQATYRTRSGVQGPLEWLRMLKDATNCGMLLIGTQSFDAATRSGPDAIILEQICKRGKAEYLSPVPTEGDLALIYACYGLPVPTPAAHSLLVDMATRFGLGEFCRTLEVVAFNARYRAQSLTWEYFCAEVQRMDERANMYAS